MTNFNQLELYTLDRETLEQLALEEVCSCLYYELADNIEVTGNGELVDIICGDYTCEMCGMGGVR